jgi:hypothetical protein
VRDRVAHHCTRRLHTLVTSICLPVPNTPSEFQAKRLAPRRVTSSAWGPLTAGEAHDNRLAGKLLSRLRSGTMLLADRGYDADWIRPLPPTGARGPTSRQEAIATTRSASARISIVPTTWSSGSSTRSNSVGGSLLASISLRPTISPSSSWHQYGYGCVSMSPRPNRIVTSQSLPNLTAN